MCPGPNGPEHFVLEVHLRRLQRPTMIKSVPGTSTSRVRGLVRAERGKDLKAPMLAIVNISQECFAYVRDSIRPTFPAAIPAVIAQLKAEVDPDALEAVDDARAEISRFDAEPSSMLPGTEIAPVAAVQLRTESASSSQI